MLVTDNVILCAQILQESTYEEVKTSVTQQPELAVQKIDPLEEPMRQFSAFLECEFDEKAKKVARFETLRKKAEDKITGLHLRRSSRKPRSRSRRWRSSGRKR